MNATTLNDAKSASNERSLTTQLKERGVNVTTFRSLRDSLFPGARNESILMVLDYCAARGLDPMKKPCHIVPMEVSVKQPKGPPKKVWRDVVMPGVYELRMTAHETGEYMGHPRPEYGPDITYLGVKAPEYCDFTARRWNKLAKQVVEFPVRVYFVESVGTKKKDGKERVNARWTKAPRQMITKSAEAAALREAFPGEIGGQMTAEEMDGQDVIDITPPHTETDPPEDEDIGQSASDEIEDGEIIDEQAEPEAQDDPKAKSDDDLETPIDFGTAFKAITTAKSVDDLDVLRSRIDQSDKIPDAKKPVLQNNINARFEQLNGGGDDDGLNVD